jgi:hypothetical protein
VGQSLTALLLGPLDLPRIAVARKGLAFIFATSQQIATLAGLVCDRCARDCAVCAHFVGFVSP